MTDHLVLFMPSGKRGNFATGTPILEAARQLGVYVESVCGGRGICGRCQVETQFGHFAKHGITSEQSSISELGAKEIRYAEKRDLKEDRRLSCSALIMGDLVVDIPQDTVINAQVVRKDADQRVIERNSAVRMCYIEVEEPDMHSPSGDMDRLIDGLEKDWQISNPRIDSHLVSEVQSVLRAGKWSVTVAVHQETEQSQAEIIAIYPELKNEAYGIACDIGSTTIALHLTSLLSGSNIASAGTSNPQIRFGEDLMSRVSYVMMNPDGREAMTKAVRKSINELIDQVCEDSGIDRHDILDSVFVGNPVMHHLFLGIDPTELGGAPFALAVSGAVHLKAKEIDIELNKGARTYILPCIAGHVGADAAAATLCEGPHRQDEMMLLIDVGTNAEIVLGNSSHAVAASSPTGPAFEGAETSCGQRAAPGAIERIRIDPETLEPRYRIIGVEQWSNEDGFEENAKEIGITGICGSGIIEVIAEMYLAGIISEDGVLNGKLAEKSDRIFEDGRTFSYLVKEGEPRIIVTQNDVRAIQLAKAALYAGVKLLMDKQKVTSVDKIGLAGAFGSFIDPKYAMILGLVPDCIVENVKAVGNAAGTGARMALLNRDYRREIEKTVRDIEKIETALEPSFQEHFVNAMAFPNKVDPFPKLEKTVILPPREMNSVQRKQSDQTQQSRRRGGRNRRPR
jgi:uncharacterized 2Fe-2S/4Fe-4S cluster protein (DUF4445 family)